MLNREVMLLGGSVGKKWMKYFMSSGKQSEHVAFLAMWLSRFVLLRCNSDIVISDFSVAIYLSRIIHLLPILLWKRETSLCVHLVVETSL